MHRPRYDDWSVPKGKVDPGETDEEAALREVEEETGVRATLGAELESTRYRDRKGRTKQVRYWLMEPVDGKVPKFRPEQRDRRCCAGVRPPMQASSLSHDHDRKLIRRRGGPSLKLYLVRHAKAGEPERMERARRGTAAVQGRTPPGGGAGEAAA